MAEPRVPGTGLLENIGGALFIAGVLVTPFLHRFRDRWGATSEETQRSYPGDDIITAARGGTVHAINIDAPMVDVWPWIHQIGQQRGGFYSYQRLENLVGCEITNVNRLLPELPELEVGRGLWLHPTMPPMRVAICDAPRSLVLHGLNDTKGQKAVAPDEPRPDSWYEVIWSFHLFDLHGERTRLVTRTIYDHNGGFGNALTTFVVGAISYVMERRMMRSLCTLVPRAPGTH